MKSRILPAIFLSLFSFFHGLAQTNETEPNNTAATANTIAVSATGNGRISTPSDVDWWKIALGTDGKLDVTVTDKSADYTNFYLYDNNGTIVLNSGTVGSYNTSTFSTDGLAAGTYYIEFTGYNTNTDTLTYSFTTALTPPPVANDAEPDSTRALALTLPLDGSVTGHLGYYYNNHRDSSDWYKVTTNSDGLLRLQITTEPSSINAYINYTLYDNNGITVLNSSTVGSATTNVFSTDGLAAGTYYIKMSQYNPTDYVSYVLADSLFTPPVANDVEPDSTRALALTLPLDGSVTGHIGYYYNNHRDSSDWYKVTTNSDGLLRLQITTEPSSINAYINYTLYDNNGITVLNSSTVGSATTNVFSTDGLAAGTYYIKMSQYNPTDYVSYVLADSLFTPPVANDVEPNNSKATADSFPLNTTITGHVGYYYNNQRDSSDWYKVTTNTDGMLQFTITTEPSSLNAYINYALYDNNGTTVIANNTIGSNTTNVYNIDGLAKGTYYLRMYQYSASDYVSYKVKDSLYTYLYAADSSYEPNNYAAQAKTILSNRTTTGHFGFYYNNSRDAVDWFKINYTGTGNLSLTFNHLPHISDGAVDYVNFAVYQDTTASPVYSTTFGGETTDNVNLTNLTEGYYYIKISQYGSNDFEAYSITDNFNQVNIAAISVKSAVSSPDSCSGSSITYNLSQSHSPYGVTLYYNGVRYDSVSVATDTVRFSNLPPGNYYATVYGDGATDAAFGTSATTALLPPTPKGLTTSNILVHTAQLNWAPFSCVKSYSVQYRLSSATTWTTLSDANDTTGKYTLSGLIMYTSYTWRIASVDTAQGVALIGNYSDTMLFKTLSDTAIITVTKVTPGTTCNSSSIKYTSTHSVAPYTVQLYRNGVVYGSPVSSVDTTLFTGLPAGIYYATSSGTGSGGSYGTSAMDTLLPPVPTGLSTTAITTTSATLNWTPLSCEHNYVIEYHKAGVATWTTINSLANTTGTYMLSGLSVYTSYVWRIASSDSAEGKQLLSPYADSLSFITLSNPARITLFRSVQTNACYSDTLKYTTSNSAAPYTVQLYRDSIAYGSPVSVTDTAVFTGLPSGVYFATASGTGSGGTVGKSAITTLAPPFPTNLSTDSITGTTAVFNWTPLNCVSYFTLQYRLNSSSDYTTIIAPSDSSSYHITGLTPNTMYVWRIASVDTTNGAFIVSSYSSNITFTTMSVLPVTLINFSAKPVNNTVQLSWQTANETNSRYFAVERSADGIVFSTVGTVSSIGNSTTQHQYSFTDNSPLKGTSYYLLRQVDNDGRYTDSRTIAVTISGASLFTLYPNPAVSVVHINLTASSGSSLIVVYDMNGKAVIQKEAGSGVSSQTIDVSSLAAGTYTVVLWQDNQQQSLKFVKN